MNEARTFDAIVIGAGPAGSTAAREIALAGWRVALVERDEFPGAHNVCGGGLEEADAALLKVPPTLIHKTLSHRMHVFPWGMTETVVPHVNLVRREFDRYLARQAVEAGAELFVRTWALAVEVTKPGQVRVQGKDLARGEQVCYQARLVVFADGPHTLAWRALRLGFARRPTSAGVGLVYELAWPDNPLNGYEVHFGAEVASWGYAWVFPKRDELNVGLWCLPSKGRESRHLNERLRRFIAGHPLLRGRRVLRRRGALIPVTPARRIYGPSALVVGDAAGMVDPLTGAGIANGMVAARLAAEVAREALARDNCSAAFLSRYQEQWQATDRHRAIMFQHRLTQALLPLSHLDRNLYAKMMQVLFLDNGLSRWQKLGLLGYPFLRLSMHDDGGGVLTADKRMV